jgi:hypothetical protein
MEELRLHKPLTHPGPNDVIIALTDIQLHTNARPTGSLIRNVLKAIRNKTPGRIFFPIQNKVNQEDNVVRFDSTFPNNELMEFVRKCRAEGKRVFLQKPSAPLPVYAGKDTEEFMKSTKGQRILRRFRKRN